MSSLAHDLKQAVRSVRRSPGLAVTGVVILTVGIGANVAVFSLLNAVFLRPLPVEEPSRLVSLHRTDEGAQVEGLASEFAPLSFMNYEKFRERNEVFTDLAAFCWMRTNILLGDEVEQIWGEIVTADYFEVLGVEPMLGTVFTSSTGHPREGDPVVVLGAGIWRRFFGADPDILGETVRVNGHAVTVLGVMPPEFKGTSPLSPKELWVPMGVYEQIFPYADYVEQNFQMFNAVGRLLPGVSLDQAEENLKAVGHWLQREDPEANRDRGVNVVPLLEVMVDPNRRDLIARGGLILMAGVGFILLVSCANLGTLLVVRASARQREIATRLCLGISRWRLARGLFIESGLLALAGGALGLLLGVWGSLQLWKLRPPFVPEGSLDLTADPRVIAFSLGLSLATVLLFGLLPALQSSRTDLASVIKTGEGSERKRRALPARHALMVVQVTLAAVVLVVAGLFVRSFEKSREADPGFRTEDLVVASFELSGESYDTDRVRDFVRQLRDGVRSKPGVRAVALGERFPLNPAGIVRRYVIQGKTDEKGDLIRSDVVDPGYFDALGLRVVEGRGFRETDDSGTRKIAVINRTMADHYWPDRSPVGLTFRLTGDAGTREIVGVVEDSDYLSVGQEAEPFLYYPLAQSDSSALNLFVRAEGDLEQLISTVRSEFRALDPTVPLSNIMTGYKEPVTMTRIVEDALWGRRLLGILLPTFGVLALVLTLVGAFGVISYSVSLRHREIGIQMALGAGRSTVARSVLGESVKLAGLGIGAGSVIALVLGRYIQGFLYSVSIVDPWVYGLAALLILTTVTGASLVPGWRAVSITPADNLRS